MHSKFIPVDVYSNARYNGCSLEGITETHADRLVVPHERGHMSLADLSQRGYKVLALDENNPGRPCFRNALDSRRGSFGGAFVWSNDSRFREAYGHNPVPVHDRFE